MEKNKYCVGIDVSKSHLDVYISGESFYKRYLNTADDISNLMKTLQKNEGEHYLLCEATGGYERLLVQAGNQNNFKMIVIQPRQIRSFAKSMNIYCKTDKVDAKVLALFCQHFGEKLHPHKHYPLHEELRLFVRRRNELVERKVSLQNHLEPLLSSDLTFSSYQEELDFLQELIKKVEQDIKAYIKSHTSLKQGYDLLLSIRGIGAKVAAEILAEIPEIKELSPNQLAALVGLSPMNKDSGRYIGKRSIQGGRKQIRKALYMAALTAIKYDSSLKTFYQRLIDQGKQFKVAITAVCRKLILTAQAVLIRGTSWLPNLPA